MSDPCCLRSKMASQYIPASLSGSTSISALFVHTVSTNHDFPEFTYHTAEVFRSRWARSHTCRMLATQTSKDACAFGSPAAASGSGALGDGLHCTAWKPAATPFRPALHAADCTASGSVSVPTAPDAPIFSAAMARTPDPAQH